MRTAFYLAGREDTAAVPGQTHSLSSSIACLHAGLGESEAGTQIQEHHSR